MSMKVLAASAILLVFTVSAFSHADKVASDRIVVTARSIFSGNGVKTLSGNVTIETSTVRVRADKAVFNVNTRNIQAQGNVDITLKR